MTSSWQALLDERKDAHIAELIEFLKIPSISTSPDHKDDVRAAATWVVERLRKMGVPDVEVAESAGHPAVIGAWLSDPAQPTILFYGHYDVQPVDPLALWETDPFGAPVRDGRIYARGAADMKGNLLTVIQGLEAVADANGGKLPINVRFIFEGEEEIGSPNLGAIIRENKEQLQADAVVSADGGLYGPETAAVAVALKGLGGCQIDLKTANTDLHSGMWGAAVPNAVQAMVQLAATFHDREGRVAVGGFYDPVIDLTDEDRAEIAALPNDDEASLKHLGLSTFWGEPGWTPAERRGGRPTLDMNGIWGGFTGEGGKTVTPNEAHLKVTCRLVANQEPLEVIELIRAHVEKHCPPGATATVTPIAGSARPYSLPRDNVAHVAVTDVLRDLYGKDPLVVRVGGTVPATGLFRDELGLDTATMGWSQPDSQIHAPNEWYAIEDHLTGRTGMAMLVERLKR